MAAVYTINYKDRTGRSKDVVVCAIAYTADTYSSGLTVDKAQFGFPNAIEDLEVMDAGAANTDIWKWDNANSKLRRYVEGAGTYAETSGAQTVTVTVRAVGW